MKRHKMKRIILDVSSIFAGIFAGSVVGFTVAGLVLFFLAGKHELKPKPMVVIGSEIERIPIVKVYADTVIVVGHSYIVKSE